jgi:hypothetical protein
MAIHIQSIYITALTTREAMDPFQEQPAVEVKKWDEDELLKWIQQKWPKLLNADRLEKLNAAGIPGEAFLMLGGNAEFFKNECHLPLGISLFETW